MPVNEFGQRIGEAVTYDGPATFPRVERLEGRYTILETLSSQKHAKDLFAVYGPDSPRDMWTYLFQEPVETLEELERLLEQLEASTDRVYYAILDKVSGKALGTFSLMRIDQNNRVIEVGAVTFSPALKRTRIGTEAQYLLARYVFEDLGYRRYEWKCDQFNGPSRKAALRLGFTFEGTFRQAVIYKGRTRDTDWFSMLDTEWPARKARFENWLEPDNFDEEGRQYKRLEDCS
ncbi:Protein export cytoplasm protein SecA ATPase RNA helicase [Streptococcus oralis]|uniref:Protein export cytoplasm protein SecA ATPase RNA helicase n=1 Tax=Streptococcus oralis TaxID=1303 RepID=A0A139RCC7_STROR|nr:GNAT family protein [Streptococcus oralis]KXU12412.1 Protein export cytoplasm protein SecA ATPase RNA helicase [Streptococcus oralis]